MKLREDYPIYLNPTDSELIELAESHWDTLRVMECDKVFVISSSYGNTHETLVQFYKKHVGKIPSWNPYIFFFENGVLLCNFSRYDIAKPSRWRREFSEERIQQFELIAQCAGLVCI